MTRNLCMAATALAVLLQAGGAAAGHPGCIRGSTSLSPTSLSTSMTPTSTSTAPTATSEVCTFGSTPPPGGGRYLCHQPGTYQGNSRYLTHNGTAASEDDCAAQCAENENTCQAIGYGGSAPPNECLWFNTVIYAVQGEGNIGNTPPGEAPQSFSDISCFTCHATS